MAAPSYLPSAIQRVLNWSPHPMGSAAAYDASKGPDTGNALYSLAQSQKGISLDDILGDPIFQLENQRVDQQYPSGGGGGGDLNAALRQAAQQYAYGGPSIDQINQFGQQGQSRIANLYGQLDQYIQAQKPEVANRFAQAQTASGAAYDKAAADMAASKAQTATDLQAEAARGGSAAQAGTQANTQAAQAAIDRSVAMNAGNRANTMSNLQTLSAGNQSILSDLGAGIQTEKGAQSGRLQDQISGMVSRAQAAMQDAAQKTAMAQQNIRDKYAQQQADAANKNAAAHTKALEDAIKRAQSNQKSSSDNLSGVQGVLAYAMRAGRPDLAKKFMDFMGSSRVNAANTNTKAENDPTGQIKKTTADEVLQGLIGSMGGTRQDLSNMNLDPRGDILNQINSTPELNFLKKYLISSPEQARQQGQYQAAFGRDQSSYQNELNKLTKNQTGTIAGQLGYAPKAQDFINQMNNRFTPFLNLSALRQNQGDVNQYYNYFGNTGDQDMMSTLYDIYSGKYGKGF